MGVDTLSIIGILTLVAITNMVVQEPEEPVNITCNTDSECIDKMQACNVFCYSEQVQKLQSQQGRCVKMMYVDNEKFPECD